MKYKINGFLYYDATEGSLKLDDTGKSDIQLTITANTLLYFLIQNPGVMTRDEVMKRVWDDKGLVSSNSNLNQYISILRKAFRHYDIENIIVTVAKGRLEINPDLDIELIDPIILHPVLATNDISSALSENSDETPDEKINLQSEGALAENLTSSVEASVDCYWEYAAIFILVCACTLFSWSFFSDSAVKTMILTPVVNDQCELLSTEDMINSELNESYVKNFNAVKDQQKIKCGKDERFLFFYGDKLQTNGLGRTFLAHCAKNEDNPFSYCDNYFYYSWK